MRGLKTVAFWRERIEQALQSQRPGG